MTKATGRFEQLNNNVDGQDKAKIRCFTDRQTDGQHGIIFRMPPIPVMKYHIITCGLHYANYYRERIFKE